MAENQVRVSNIDWTADEASIKTFLSQHAAVTEVKVIYDRQ